MKKKQTNDQKIVAAMDAIDKSTRNLQRFGERYNEYIDQAVIRGDDKRAKQLIKQKIGVFALADQLTTLKSNIELGAYTAQVAADMGKLPDAIAGCKGLLAESPNFSKLGSSIKKIFKDMEKPAEEIGKLNDILDSVLSPSAEPTLTSRLDGVPEDETTDAFKREWEAMMVRVGMKTNSGKIEPAVAPAEKAAIDPLTGDVDYAGIMADENKKQ